MTAHHIFYISKHIMPYLNTFVNVFGTYFVTPSLKCQCACIPTKKFCFYHTPYHKHSIVLYIRVKKMPKCTLFGKNFFHQCKKYHIQNLFQRRGRLSGFFSVCSVFEIVVYSQNAVNNNHGRGEESKFYPCGSAERYQRI